MSYSAGSMLLALVCSSAIGIVFGFMPARNASRPVSYTHLSYQGQGSFERWLSTIALRCCYERLRERYRPEAPFSSLARGEEDEPEGLTDQAAFRLYE